MQSLTLGKAGEAARFVVYGLNAPVMPRLCSEEVVRPKEQAVVNSTEASQGDSQFHDAQTCSFFKTKAPNVPALAVLGRVSM